MNYLVVDTDSITGIYRDAFFGWVYKKKATFDVAVLAGKATSAKTTELFATELSKLCPKVKIYKYMASSLKNHADILCGVAIGRIVERSVIQKTTQDANVFILSCDHLVTSLADITSQQGLKSFVVSVDKGNLLIKHNNAIIESVEVNTLKAKPPHVRILPDWATQNLTKEEKMIGLICEKVPTEEFFAKPLFIPFHIDEIDIGSGGGDIDLSAWDFPQKGLYPKNITIKYNKLPKSLWTIRSNKGFRRNIGNAIAVDGKIIDSSSLDVAINNGTKIDLGGFSFRFFFNRLETFLRFETDVEIAKQIELHLKECSSQIPWRLIEREHILGYKSNDLAPDFHNATYCTYLDIIKRFWDWFPTIGKRYQCKTFDDEFRFDIKEGRNLSDHASSGGPSKVQKKKMIKFLFILQEELRDWDANHNGK